MPEAQPAQEAINPKDLAGRSKPQLHLIPLPALLSVSRVMELGSAKYGPHNWRDQPIGHTPYISAMMRHLIAFSGGEDLDPESGQSHLAHIASGAMILLDAREAGTAKDDRPGGVVRAPANDDNYEIGFAEFHRRYHALSTAQRAAYSAGMVGKVGTSEESDAALRAAEKSPR